MSRPLYLNLLLAGAGFLPHAAAAARRPFDPLSLVHSRQAALTAERAGFAALTLAEARQLSAGLPAGGVLPDPLTWLPALAALTSRIGLIAQVGAQHTQPYNTARRLASLDHASRGRAGGWLLPRSREREAANFDHDDTADALARLHEYEQVLRGLWDSWEDDARQFDTVTPRYVDTSKVRALDHVGSHFRVAGPIDIPRPPQGWPVLVRTLASDAAADVAALADAEVVVTEASTLAQARERYAQVRAVAPQARILPCVTVLASPSAAQRERQRAAWRRDGHDWTPPWAVLQGSPDELVPLLAQWRDQGAADGFTFAPAVSGDELDDLADYLLPALQRHGLARAHLPGATLREHLDLPRPAGRRQPHPVADLTT